MAFRSWKATYGRPVQAVLMRGLMRGVCSRGLQLWPAHRVSGRWFLGCRLSPPQAAVGSSEGLRASLYAEPVSVSW